MRQCLDCQNLNRTQRQGMASAPGFAGIDTYAHVSSRAIDRTIPQRPKSKRLLPSGYASLLAHPRACFVEIHKGVSMGCAKRILYAAILGLFAITFALTLLVIGSAGTLGEAAFVSADDLLVIFFLNLASVVGLVILILLLWQGARRRKRQEQTIADLRQRLSAAAVRIDAAPAIPPADSTSMGGPNLARFCGNCGAAVEPADRVCGNCGVPISIR